MAVLGRLFNTQECRGIPRLPGVYRILCIPSNKSYIGLSTNIRFRINTHRKHLARDEHANIHMQKAYKKYGADAFVVEVLEILEKADDSALIKAEGRWVAHFNALNPDYGYNISITQEDGKIRQTEEHKRRMSDLMRGKSKSQKIKDKIRQSLLGRRGAQHTEEFKQSVSARFKGVKKTEAHRANLSASKKGKPSSLKGRPGRPASDEARKNMAKAKIGKTPLNAVCVIDTQGNSYLTIKEASIALGKTRSQIETMLKRNLLVRAEK